MDDSARTELEERPWKPCAWLPEHRSRPCRTAVRSPSGRIGWSFDREFVGDYENREWPCRPWLNSIGRPPPRNYPELPPPLSVGGSCAQIADCPGRLVAFPLTRHWTADRPPTAS